MPKLTEKRVKISRQRRDFRREQALKEGISGKCVHRPVPTQLQSENTIAEKGIKPGVMIVANREVIPRKVVGFDENMRLILAGTSDKPYPRDVTLYSR